MKRKGNGRIYPGEYLFPGDRTPAQREFFLAILRRAPQVLESLRKQLLPEFRRQRLSVQRGKRSRTGMYALAWEWAASHRLVTGERLFPVKDTCQGLSAPEVEARYAAFKNSCEETFFYPWAWFAILGTLFEWEEHPQQAGLDWVMPFRSLPIEDGSELLQVGTHDEDFDYSALFSPPKSVSVTFEFQCPIWDVRGETRGEAEKRILGELRNAMKQHLDQTEKMMKAIEVPKSPVRLSPEHFDWLVEYQLNGIPYNRIAQDFADRDAQTVTEGVKDAAMQVVGQDSGRWLRPSKAGRPRKTPKT